VRALISISNPFDVLATTIKLKNTSFGVFDYFLATKLYNAYKQKRFKNQHLFVDMEEINNCKKSILDLDNITRAKAFGFNSANELYREISCGHYLSYIDKPFMIIYSRDDIIVKD
jgi:predicted alpha/beta-fold hydrolase